MRNQMNFGITGRGYDGTRVFSGEYLLITDAVRAINTSHYPYMDLICLHTGEVLVSVEDGVLTWNVLRIA